jgi:cytochrome c556
MRMKLVVGVVALSALIAAGIAGAQEDPIKARKAVMEKNQDAAKIVFGMAQGKTPFDAAQAAAAMKTIQDDMAVFPTLFPEGSDQGDTAAQPAIWQNMDDFKAKAAKLAADAKTAEAAAAQGLDAFAASLGDVGRGCGACHELYRKKRS